MEPESLDEEYLQQPMICIYEECKFEGTFREVIEHQVTVHAFTQTPHDSGIFEPEYQHPEDTMEIFEQYERLTDDRIPED